MEDNQPEYRVKVGRSSFELQRLVRRTADGDETWATSAFCRKLSDLRQSLLSRGISADMVGPLPRHHPDSLASLLAYESATRPQSEAQRAAARERMRQIRGARANAK